MALWSKNRTPLVGPFHEPNIGRRIWYPKSFGQDLIDDSINYLKEHSKHHNPTTELWMAHFYYHAFKSWCVIIVCGWRILSQVWLDTTMFEGRINKRRGWKYKCSGFYKVNDIIRQRSLIFYPFANVGATKPVIYSKDLVSLRAKYEYSVKNQIRWTFAAEITCSSKWRIFSRIFLGRDYPQPYPTDPSICDRNLVDEFGRLGVVRYPIWMDLGLTSGGVGSKYGKYVRELKTKSPLMVIPPEYWTKKKYAKKIQQSNKEYQIFSDDDRRGSGSVGSDSGV